MEGPERIESAVALGVADGAVSEGMGGPVRTLPVPRKATPGPENPTERVLLRTDVYAFLSVAQ
jgi:hypothetical protein